MIDPSTRPGAVIFDAGGLIAWERGDRRMAALLATAVEQSVRMIVPSTVLAQVMRDQGRQVRLGRLIRHPLTEVAALDRREATAVGALVASSRTTDIVDAHVVVCTRRIGGVAITSDPDDLAALDPDVSLIAI